MWNEMLDAKVDYVNINSYRTRYISAGQGDPVVLVHGTGGSLENFSKIFVKLKQNYKVYAVDLLGYGLSEKPTNIDYDIPTWGTHLEAFIKKVVDAPVYLVGHSLGGWISSWVAFNSTIHLKGLILLTSIGFELTEKESHVLTDFYQKHRESSVKPITKDFVRKRLQMLVKDPEFIPEEWVDLRYDIYNRFDTKKAMIHWVDYVPGLVQQSKQVQPYLLTKENLNKLDIPLLFIIADHDSFTSVNVVEKLAKKCPNTSIYIVKDAGHWPHVEKRDEVVEVLDYFLNNKKIGENYYEKN